MRSELVAVASDAGELAGVYDPSRNLEVAELEGTLRRALAVEGDVRTLVAGEGLACLVVGEIYDLGSVAEAAGTPPQGKLEELIALAYRRLGERVLSELRGAFTILLWDGERRRALLAGDQLAVRAPYFCSSGSRLTFASETRALVRILPRRPGPDAAAVVHWITNSTPPAGRTLYEGVEVLPGGRYLELTERGASKHTYWEPRYEPPLQASRTEVVEGLWEALLKAVGARLGSGESIGIVMSGGVDSSAVSTAALEAAAVRGFDAPRGYSAVFPGHPDPRVDESERIDRLIGGTGLSSFQASVHPAGLFSVYLEWLREWELPIEGPGYLIERPLVGRAAEDGAVAILDGQGGDELFALSGYLAADLLRRGRLLKTVRIGRTFPGAAEISRRQLYGLLRQYAYLGNIPYRLHRARHLLGGPERFGGQDYLSPESQRLHLDTDESLNWKRQRGVPRWWASKRHLLTQAREDVGVAAYVRHRAAIAGLTARPPLFDLDLVEFALRIPPEYEFDPHMDRPLIREAMRGRVPDEVRLSTRKSNLGPWYVDVLSGSDLELIRELFDAEQPELAAYTRIEAVRKMAEGPPSHGAGSRIGWMSDLSSLAATECWLQYERDPAWIDRFTAGKALPAPASSVHKQRAAAPSRVLSA